MKKSNFQTTTTIAILLLAAGDRVAFGFVSPIGRIPKTSCSHHENNKPKVIRTILDPRLMMSLSTKEKDKEKETKSAILISEEPSQLHRVEVDDHRQIAVSDPHANRSEPSRDLRFTNGRLIVGNNENDEDANNRLENWVDESKHVELVALSIWMAVISAFVLINNFIGPFPSAVIMAVPERTWFFGHMLGGMLFGGGILMTTAIEYMVAETKDASVLQFWFDKVPLLDSAMVLPGLTLAMVSGVSLSVQHYGSLGTAPPHIQYVFWALTIFALWWGVTDLTSQGSALNAVQRQIEQQEAEAEMSKQSGEKVDNEGATKALDVPDIVTKRTISNVVSCVMVFAVYWIMVMKPGTLFWRPH